MDLGSHIRQDPYIRERLAPQPGDFTYLHLADLKMALEFVEPNRALKVLDYGCGGSPYRSLFTQADYRRADYLQGENDALDYLLSADSKVSEKDGAFDFILSTQVLEHVEKPGQYLSECFRLLSPGGRLYLSTHGTYPDHGCPDDFYRWTADGLVKDLTSAGFKIVRVEKHTTGPRALFFNCDCQLANLSASRRTLFGCGLFIFQLIYQKLKPWIHRMCDRHFSHHRVVTDNLDQHPLYIVTACLAQKP